MKKIEAFQIKKIYAIGNALGIAESGCREDDLHVLVCGTTGKASIRGLSYEEADAVISKLEQQQGIVSPPKRKRKDKKHLAVPGGITEGQQRKVWALMYDLKKCDAEPNSIPVGERLCGIIRKELKVECLARNPFVWLDFSAGNKLIEVLKNYVSNAKRQMR